MTKGSATATVNKRADARQNRERILEAADRVLLRDGIHAPLDAVIQEAGVGKTTFFRHFPDRQNLMASLLERSATELEKEAEQVRDRPDGLYLIISQMAERIGLRSAFASYWNAAESDHPAIVQGFARMEPIFTEAVARARDAGLCRQDLTSRDLAMIGRMLAAAIHDAPKNEKVQVAKRAAQLLIEGYRAGA